MKSFLNGEKVWVKWNGHWKLGTIAKQHSKSGAYWSFVVRWESPALDPHGGRPFKNSVIRRLVTQGWPFYFMSRLYVQIRCVNLTLCCAL